eukprot:scpid70929/ scgid34185/ 
MSLGGDECLVSLGGDECLVSLGGDECLVSLGGDECLVSLGGDECLVDDDTSDTLHACLAPGPLEFFFAAQTHYVCRCVHTRTRLCVCVLRSFLTSPAGRLELPSFRALIPSDQETGCHHTCHTSTPLAT